MQYALETIASFFPGPQITTPEGISQVEDNDSNNKVSTSSSNQNDINTLTTSVGKVTLADDSQSVDSIPTDSPRPDTIPVATSIPSEAVDTTIAKPPPTHYQTNAFAHESTKKPIPATLADPEAAMREQLGGRTTDQLHTTTPSLDIVSGVASISTHSPSKYKDASTSDDHTAPSDDKQGVSHAGKVIDQNHTPTDISYDPTNQSNDSDLNEPKIKVPLGDKISGSIEKMVGKLTQNEEKIEHGELKKTGQI